MKTNMNLLAEHIIQLAKENNLEISNLKLHKVLYFTLINYLKTNPNDTVIKNSIYDEEFEAWKFGPVLPSVYDRFCKYGPLSIMENFKLVDKFTFLNDIIIQLLKEDLFDLVDESWTHTLWKKNESIIKTKHMYTGVKYKFNHLRNVNV